MNTIYSLVSVVIPTYGRPTTLAAAIMSVREQTYRNVEIIVVDDNAPNSESRLATRKLIQELPDSDIPVIYVELPHNMGGALARNEGVMASHGELLTFLDDDDIYLPRKIERQVAVISNDIDICVCAFFANDNGRSANYIRTQPSGETLAEFLLDGSAFTPAIMVRRDLFLEAGGFLDTPRFQDHVLTLRLLGKSERIKLIHDRLFIHNLHLGDRVSFSNRTREAFLIKHGVECSLQSALNDEQKKKLAYKQMLDLYECDLFESSRLERLQIIISKLQTARSLDEFLLLMKFSIRKSLRRSAFVWKIRRLLFSKKINLKRTSA